LSGARALVGVVVGLRAEAACLRVGDRPANTLLRIAGPGPGRAEQAARALLEAGAGGLVSFGCAAALDPELAPGCLLVPARLHGADDEPYTADPAWHARLCAALEGLAPVTGPLAEARAPLTDARLKAAARSGTGACAADMESVGVARVAGGRAVPFVVLRAVADSAADRVPRSALAALRSDGGVSPGALAAGVVRRPRELAELVRLARAFAAARASLKRAAVAAAQVLGGAPG